MSSADTSLEELNLWMQAHHMRGFWVQGGAGFGPPRTPHLWKWADFSAGVLKAGELVPAGQSGRSEARGIGLLNPNERGIPKVVSLSPQILRPGERTPAHRDLNNETCFVIQASPGATCVVEGEAFPMEVGDLIVSPSGAEHYYSNRSADSAIWLNGVDIDLLRLTGSEIPRGYPPDGQPQTGDKPSGFFSATQSRMKDPGGTPAFGRPPMRYPWQDTFTTLTAFKEGNAIADLYDGIRLRYAGPVDRGPTLPTFSCEIQLLKPGIQTRAHRHSSTTVYYVFRGEGSSDVAGERLEWAKGDIFSVPPWASHRHENPASEDAILFSLDDGPAMVKMGFYRVEEEEDPGDPHQ